MIVSNKVCFSSIFSATSEEKLKFRSWKADYKDSEIRGWLL